MSNDARFQKKIKDRVEAKRTRIDRERREAENADERLRQKEALAVEFASKLLHEIVQPRMVTLAKEMNLPEPEMEANPNGTCLCRSLAKEPSGWRSVLVRVEPAGQDLLIIVAAKRGKGQYENDQGNDIYNQPRLFDVEQMNPLHVADWLEDELANCAAELTL